MLDPHHRAGPEHHAPPPNRQKASRHHEGRRRSRTQPRHRQDRRQRQSPGSGRLRRRLDSRDEPRSVPALGARRRTHRNARTRHIDCRRLRPKPDAACEPRLGSPGAQQGSLQPRPRHPDQAPHHQAVLHGMEQARSPGERDDLGHQRHLGHLGARRTAAVPRRVLHPHPDDPVLHARQERPRRFRPPEHLARRRRRTHDSHRR